MAQNGIVGARGKLTEDENLVSDSLYMLKQAMFGHLDQDVGPHDFASKPIQKFSLLLTSERILFVINAK